jgi:hypothetical protein
MADVTELVPPAVDQTDNTTIVWVPTIADVTAPKAATEVKNAASKRLTYSFTTDGWNITGDQDTTTDDRLTLNAVLQAFGKTTYNGTLKYVDSTDTGSAAVVLVEGLLGYFVERRGMPNKTDFAAAQMVIVYQVTLGKQIRSQIDGNGKFTITQKVIITGVVKAPVALAA